MSIEKFKFRDIFEMIHDASNKQFYQHLVMMTRDEEGYPCALSDENVRYGTNSYDLFEKAVRKDFSEYVAQQILDYEMYVDISDAPRFVAMDTTVTYFASEGDSEKKILFVNAYPEREFEETKMYKSGNCSPLSLFGF